MKKIIIPAVSALIAVLFIIGCTSLRTGVDSAPVSFDSDLMDSYFNLLLENDRAMGSLSVFVQGSEVYSNQIGYRDLSNNLAHDRNTQFRIGSISKTYLTVIIMQMVEEGRLTLETRLSEFFPQVTNAHNITIRHLLQHRSGVFNYTDDESFVNWMFDDVSKAELLGIISSYESNFEPGTEESYSNSAFYILALITEIIDGIPYSDILQRRIVNPLGLTITHLGDEVNPLRNEALPYIYAREWQEIVTFHPSVILGAGDIVSTPYELNVFMHNLFSGNLVSNESLNEMQNRIDMFGLGLIPVPFYNRMGYGHTGGMPGFQAISVYFPDDGISVSYTTNGVRLPQNDILVAVLSILYNENFTLPEFTDTIILPLEILEQHTGVYESDDIPLAITVFIIEGSLFAQATGQSAFPLDALDENNFVFDTAMIHMEFFPETGEMIMTQAGMEFRFRVVEL